MDAESYQPWDPFPQLKGSFYCEGLHDDYEGFRILLRIDNLASPMLRLAFQEPLMYQHTQESFRLATPAAGALADPLHSFHVVENSRLVAEFHRESHGTCGHWDIRHFAIHTCNDFLDVLSVAPPLAEVLPLDDD